MPTACHARAYDDAVGDYAAAEGYGEAWAAFMVGERERYCLAWEVAGYYAARGPVVVSVSYASGGPWEDEARHLALFSQLFAATYPGLAWDVTDEPGGDVDLVLGAALDRGRVGRVTVAIDGIAAHEMGHALGLPHHYDSEAEVGMHLHEPLPEETCVLDRTGYGLDSACSFATGAGRWEGDADGALGAILELNAGG